MGPNLGHQRPSRPGGGPSQTSRTPDPVQYYKDGLLKIDLVDKEAEDVADELADAGLENTQLRRYYENVLALKRRLEHESANNGNGDRDQVFARLRPEFKLMRAKAHYANARDRRTFPDRFLKFFESHTRSVQTVKDFDAFCKHFEAVVAFHRYKKDRKRRS